MRKFETVEIKQDAADLKDVVRASPPPDALCDTLLIDPSSDHPLAVAAVRAHCAQVMNKFYGKMQEFKEEKQPLPQDLQQGADEDEWSD
jgi:hypothetical protein